MKRDKDLIQQILAAIEASANGLRAVDLGQLEGRGYSAEAIASHLVLLREATLIKGIEIVEDGPEGLPVVDWIGPARLTWQGYEYLDAAREGSEPARQKETPSPVAPRAKTGPVEPERVLWEGQPAWAYYTGAFIVGTVGIALILPGILTFIGIFLDRRFRHFTLTTRRVKLKSGWLTRTSNEVLLQDIRLINLNQGFFERIAGLGSIQIGSAGTGQIEITFAGIKSARKVKDLIDRHRDSRDRTESD